jgi:DNA-directed RNA polymerase
VHKRTSPRERQKNLEQASLSAAENELRRSHEMLHNEKKPSPNGGAIQDDVMLQRQRLQGWMYEWMGALKTQLAEDIQKMRDRTSGNEDSPISSSTGTLSGGMKEDVLSLYLTLLPVDKLALITIIELMRQAGSHGVSDGMKALRGMLAVGKAVETEYRAETIKTVAGVDSPQWLRTLDHQTQKPTRQLVGTVWKKLGKQLNDPSAAGGALARDMERDLRAVWTPAWSQMTHLGIGSYLVKTLLGVAKVSRSATDPMTGEQV